MAWAGGHPLGHPASLPPSEPRPIAPTSLLLHGALALMGWGYWSCSVGHPKPSFSPCFGLDSIFSAAPGAGLCSLCLCRTPGFGCKPQALGAEPHDSGCKTHGFGCKSYGFGCKPQDFSLMQGTNGFQLAAGSLWEKEEETFTSSFFMALAQQTLALGLLSSLGFHFPSRPSRWSCGAAQHWDHPLPMSPSPPILHHPSSKYPTQGESTPNPILKAEPPATALPAEHPATGGTALAPSIHPSIYPSIHPHIPTPQSQRPMSPPLSHPLHPTQPSPSRFAGHTMSVVSAALPRTRERKTQEKEGKRQEKRERRIKITNLKQKTKRTPGVPGSVA